MAQLGSWELDLVDFRDLTQGDLRWSDEVFRIWGHEPGGIEVSCANFLAAVHPDDRRLIDDAVSAALHDNRSYDLTHRILRPDGSERIVRELVDFQFEEGSGRPLRMIGTVQDITEQRRAEESLRLLNSVVLQSSESILITDAEFAAPGPRIIFANPAFTQMTGYSAEEVIGKTPRILQGPRTEKTVLRRLRKNLEEGALFQGETINYRKDGTHYNQEWRVAPIRDSAGKITHYVAIQRDITERKKIEARIQEQATFIDQAHDAIIVRDLDHRVVFWSKGAERLYGWTAAEAVGSRFDSLLHVDQTKFDDAIRAIREKGKWNGEIEKVAKGGIKVISDESWTLLRDAEGLPKSILSIDSDITERKKIELQFLRAQRLESIGTLAGGIAHDLNNLLAPIVMGVDLIKQYDPNPRILPVIENIARSAKRGTDLVKQVLSFARGIEGIRSSLQVRTIIREVESIAASTFPKNIDIRTDVAPDIWLVTADPSQINQVLLNLCVNARDAMPDGGRLELTATNMEIDEQYAIMDRGVVPGRYIALQVADNGCGMPKEVVDRIFEPFFTTKEIGKGTGLGLSTVTGIVRSHGGFVNVYSEPGKGSVFKVYLPALADGAGEDAPDSKSGVLPRGNGELILVVDDEVSILEITKQTLETFGYKVMTAEDGAQAIGLYAMKQETIAVVLTDMMMPVMGGPALIAALHRINPAVRIIAASGIASNANAVRAASAGVKHFLARPYSAEAMLKVLKTVLGEKTGGGSSRSPL